MLLELAGVRAAYGPVPVLRDVSLRVAAGELCVVLGPNGAGKSTAVRCALGLMPVSAGEVRLQGAPLASFSRTEVARQVGWVPQTFEDPGGFTVLELVLMGRAPHLGLWGLTSHADEVRAREALAELELGALADRPSTELSGGERRMALVARALVQHPRLFVLDEPTAFLDLRHQVRTLQCIRRAVRGGAGALAVLHDVNLAAAFADQLILLKEGRVLQAGPPSEVLSAGVLEALYDVPMELARAADGTVLFAPRAAG